MLSFLDKVRNFIQTNELLEHGEQVTVGVSGGADSVCLLFVLLDLQEEYDLKVQAVYVEHGIRGEESVEDGRFVEKLCISKGVPFRQADVDAPELASLEHMSLEEAARRLRYEALIQTAKHGDKGGKIAVAHNADDNVETIIYQMARGTGIRGLCGMEPLSPRKDGTKIIRPLLCVERGEIEMYLADKEQDYVTDSTNADDNYARNRIRHDILPILREINSEAVAHINESAKQLTRLYKSHMDDADRILDAVRGKQGIVRERLLKYPDAMQAEVVRRFLLQECGGIRDITRAHFVAAVDLLSAEVGKRIDLPGGIKLKADYDELIVEKIADEEVPQDPWSIDIPKLEVGESYEISLDEYDIHMEVVQWTAEEEIPDKTYAKIFDYDKIRDKLNIRSRNMGDRMQVLADGGTKRLKDYFIDEKIPKEERDSIPLLAEGQDILWVIGYRRSEAALVTDETSRVLKVEVWRN
ncbi:MAG: tRNA lysidine(34) synthetase TilS [Lachnospiraceae bacterium]|nr:tRNA lysidine(34) synthetase TilS [Lachnospiraceae bacterium]MBQ2466751.1 tRNA lysidine(34) synthetase TilS [Lachnospiraceae bacterium]